MTPKIIIILDFFLQASAGTSVSGAARPCVSQHIEGRRVRISPHSTVQATEGFAGRNGEASIRSVPSGAGSTANSDSNNLLP